MIHKTRDSRGLTMVEMLCAVAILVLFALMLNTGLNMAMDNYRSMVLRSEADILVSTLSNVLTDELRYARNVEFNGDNTLKQYDSLLYGEDTKLTVGTGASEKKEGQIYAETNASVAPVDPAVATVPYAVLPESSYGKGMWSYGVDPASAATGMKITRVIGENCFEVKLHVKEKKGGSFIDIIPERTFYVRCLNPLP